MHFVAKTQTTGGRCAADYPEFLELAGLHSMPRPAAAAAAGGPSAGGDPGAGPSSGPPGGPADDEEDEEGAEGDMAAMEQEFAARHGLPTRAEFATVKVGACCRSFSGAGWRCQ